MNRRREFLKTASLAAASALASAQPTARVGLGIIGTGNRGTSLMRRTFALPWVEVAAVCDIDPAATARAQDILQTAGKPKPASYTGSAESYKALLDRKDIDVVIVATPWEFHVPMALAAMRSGKAAGVEVPIAQTVEECWELLETHQKTRMPCMMLENWAFRRDNLAVLNMIRLGMLGEIVHCHCAHGNDCVGRIPWYFDKEGNVRWGGRFLIERNCDQYPTHSLGPVISWMNINCGDAFDVIVTMTSRSLGINNYFAKTLGPDHPAAKRHYSQGDIASSLIRTKKGNTIVLNNDMQLPRPYDNRWMIQGTEGVYSEERNSIYLWRRSPKIHEWEPFPPHMEKHEHAWWRPEKPVSGGSDQLAAGHGGTDPLLVRKFLEAVRDRKPMPLDLYDSLAMSVIVPLSRQSAASGSTPVKFPDFTRGEWKSRKPYFAMDAGA